MQQEVLFNDGTPKIIYVYDALCGWCYGFSPVIERLYEERSDQLSFHAVSGGMITGERIGPIGEVAAYIKQAYKDVEHRTGVTFGQDFLEGVLEEGSAIFTSHPPAKALAVIKREQPDQSVPFAADLQKGIYYHGHKPADPEWYGKLGKQYGIPQNDFLEMMEQEETEVSKKQDYKLSAQLQVTGFPTVFYTDGNRNLSLLARGYTDFEALNGALTQCLTEQTS